MSKPQNLDQLAQQLNIKLKRSESSNGEAIADSPAMSTPPQDIAAIAELEDDSQAPESNPLFKFILLGGAVFGTLGIGLIVMLWGVGENFMGQQAKKPDTLPVEVAQTPEQQKEIADLKARLVMQQQQLDASRLQQTAKTPAKPAPVAKSPAKPVVKPQPVQDPAQLAALDRQKQQQAAELAAIERSKQQQQGDLANLTRSKQNLMGQLGLLGRSRQQQIADLRALADRSKRERDRLAALKRQGNVKVAKAPQPQVVATKPTNSEPEMSWEQASALGSYGGNGDIENMANRAVDPAAPTALAMSPVLRLPVGQVVSGKLVTPFYTLLSNGEGQQQQSQKSAVSVTIDKAIEVGSGWHLPIGTTIEFDFQVADNGTIVATSKKVTYGNTEIQIPAGAFTVVGTDNQPLTAQIKQVDGDKLASADLRAAVFNGLSEVGNVLVNGNNSSTVTVGGGTTIATNNNGSPNILGAVAKGAFSPLAQTQVTRAQAIAQKLEKQSKVATLKPGTQVLIYVAVPASFQLPSDDGLNQPINSLSMANMYAPISPSPKVAAIEPNVDLTNGGKVPLPEKRSNPTTPSSLPTVLSIPGELQPPAQPLTVPQTPNPFYTQPTVPPNPSAKPVVTQPSTVSPLPTSPSNTLTQPPASVPAPPSAPTSNVPLTQPVTPTIQPTVKVNPGQVVIEANPNVPVQSIPIPQVPANIPASVISR